MNILRQMTNYRGMCKLPHHTAAEFEQVGQSSFWMQFITYTVYTLVQRSVVIIITGIIIIYALGMLNSVYFIINFRCVIID